MEEEEDVSVDTVEVETVVELEPDENVDEDDEVETRLEDELPERGSTKSGDDARANATIAVTATAVITEIFWPVFT